MEYIKHILREDYELSDEAKKKLFEARSTLESEYIDLEWIFMLNYIQK